MILLHADGTHETVTIRATATTRAGCPVVLVDGAPYVVASLKSGWCLDGRCGDCRYPSCGCDCHSASTNLRLVKPPVHRSSKPIQPVDSLWDVAIQKPDHLGRIRTAPEDADTSDRGLTHSPDATGKGLA